MCIVKISWKQCTKGFVMSSNKTEIKLSDYQAPDFLINDVFLDFDLDFKKTEVLSVIKFIKKP